MELDDLIGNIRDFFLSQYTISALGTKSFLAFEPLGHMISPEDFKLNGEFVPAKGTDQLSVVADFVPGVTAVVLSNGLNTVSGGYDSLLSSIQFYGNNVTENISDYVSLFGKIKGEAQNMFQSQPSTIGGPGSQTYVCNGNPGDWYDPDSQIWQHKVFASGSASNTSTPPSSRPVSPVLWKLNPIATKFEHNTQVNNLLTNQRVITNLAPFRAAAVNTELPKNAVAASATQVTAPHPAVSATLAPGIQIRRAPLQQRAVVPMNVKPIPPTPAAVNQTPVGPHPITLLSSATFMNKGAYNAINTGLQLNQMVILNRAIGDANNAVTSTSNSSSFSMDFYYSLVYLNRPWVDPQLIQNAKLWYALAQKKDYFSNGADDATNTGILSALPTAMIVIKNLAVTAQWSDSDKNAAASAYGLGSFNISNSSFVNNVLTASGIQIIGWICEVLPEMPLVDDANFFNEGSGTNTPVDQNANSNSGNNSSPATTAGTSPGTSASAGANGSNTSPNTTAGTSAPAASSTSGTSPDTTAGTSTPDPSNSSSTSPNSGGGSDANNGSNNATAGTPDGSNAGTNPGGTNSANATASQPATTTASSANQSPDSGPDPNQNTNSGQG